MSDALWAPNTKHGQAMLRICERAFLADPIRTYSDLLDAGNGALATQLKIDHQTGRLQENVPGAPREPRESEMDAGEVWANM